MSITPAHSLVLLDKPQGWTSHDVVGRMRRVAATKRVGHAGTLDPMATGLLLLGIGQGTRLLTHMVGLDKSYTATIRLGAATTTDDAEGEQVGETTPVRGIDPERLEEAFARLRGEILQVPSSVSAIKVDGQRAYARVRAGEEVELAARPVTIRRFEILAQHENAPFLDLDVIVECTSGTYIRALARDLGSALRLGGHLTALRRTHVGPFTVEEAAPVPQRSSDSDAPQPDMRGMGLGEAAARTLPVLRVGEDTARDLGYGKRPMLDPADPELECLAEGDRLAAAVTAHGGRLIALVRVRGSGKLVPELVIPADARS